jgi:predicted RNA polymerase sigma factor
VSERKIAEIVFGDARYRGRVERIRRRQASSLARAVISRDGAVGADDQGGGAGLPTIRELLDRHRRRLANTDELPSLKEIELLMKLERAVEADETLERLNALTRERG